VSARAWIGLAAAAWLAGPGCIITTTQQKPPPDPKTPAKLEGKTAPALEATAVPGVKHAVIDVPDVYYHEGSEKWFRWSRGKWFVAFLWNGQWFPVDRGELPREMAALEPSIEQKQERKLTRAEELKQIDEELRRIETGQEEPAKGNEAGAEKSSSAKGTDESPAKSAAKTPDKSPVKSAAKSREDELRELDEQLEQLEKQEQAEKKK
jgi:hypothetical protein